MLDRTHDTPVWERSPTEHDRYQALFHGPRPEWLRPAGTRVWNCLCWEVAMTNGNPGGLVDLQPETVREYGEQRLMRIPNMGRKSVKAIGEMLGGWRQPCDTVGRLEAARDDVVKASRRMEALLRDLRNGTR